MSYWSSCLLSQSNLSYHEQAYLFGLGAQAWEAFCPSCVSLFRHPLSVTHQTSFVCHSSNIMCLSLIKHHLCVTLQTSFACHSSMKKKSISKSTQSRSITEGCDFVVWWLLSSWSFEIVHGTSQPGGNGGMWKSALKSVRVGNLHNMYQTVWISNLPVNILTVSVPLHITPLSNYSQRIEPFRFHTFK